MRRRRRKKHTPDQMEQQRRGRKIFRVLGRVLLTGIVLAAAVVAMTVFFRVKTISVEGAEQYGSEELIAGMDVQKGDNLYLWNNNRVWSDLMLSFPYLESAPLRRKLPDGLVLTVTECSAAAAVRNEDNTFTYISAGGKVLENNAADGGLPIVLGVTLNAQIGDFLATGTDAHVDAMLNVLVNMDAAGLLEKMSFLNLNDLTDVRIGYDKRFDIRAGSLDDLTYRLRFAQTVISDRLSASDIGRLYWDAQNRLHFVPETAEDVARSGTDQAGDNPVTSPAYTNPDGEVGTTDNPDGEVGTTDNTTGDDSPDASSDSSDSSDNSDYSDDSDIDITAIVRGNRVELQKKLKKMWDFSTEVGLAYDVIVSPTVIPYDEFEQYKEKLPYYRNIVKEGRKIG